jgi:septal ring factor EnvC (AmiA/AmiB activator)
MCGLPKGCKSFRRCDFELESLLCLYDLVLSCLSDFLLSSFVETLATANARIASLEAELKASQKAYDAATAAKAAAEKSQKSALARAKKAEKALADSHQEHAQREQAVAERLHTMSAAAESKLTCLLFSFPMC